MQNFDQRNVHFSDTCTTHSTTYSTTHSTHSTHSTTHVLLSELPNILHPGRPTMPRNCAEPLLTRAAQLSRIHRKYAEQNAMYEVQQEKENEIRYQQQLALEKYIQSLIIKSSSRHHQAPRVPLSVLQHHPAFKH